MTGCDASVVPWFAPLADALEQENRAVLVVVATTQGSAPRETGAAMVVSASACTGSVGGGHLEHEATRVAREALAGAEPLGTWLIRYPLAARLGQCCGGVATLALSRIEHGAAWLDDAAACARAGAPFAIVSRVTGAPAGEARLVVTADDAQGTLGAPELDSAAIGLARTRLAARAWGAALVRSSGDDSAPLLIQIERADAFPVLLFGNGHVGRALVGVLAVVPARLRWIDSRAGDFPPTVPTNVEIVVTDTPEDELQDAPAGAFVVVTTHSHALDFSLIEASLARDDWAYLGLIGSKAKRAQFERRLAARGMSADQAARIRCPIGTEGVALRGKHPGTIAIAIAAEMLVVHEAAMRRMQAPPAIRALPRR